MFPEQFRVPAPRHFSRLNDCRTRKISAVDPEVCTFSHHSAAPVLLCAVLKLATPGLVRHLAALQYASIRG